MPILSFPEFVEAVKEVIYRPRNDRNTVDHPSAELNRGAGKIVSNLKVKFYIEDDGGTWDSIPIPKPKFIWDLKRIVSSVILDSGSHTAHLDLMPHSVAETNDGILFNGSDNSYLSSELLPTSGLNEENINLNLWFTPKDNLDGTLFRMKAPFPEIELLTIYVGSLSNDLYRIWMSVAYNDTGIPGAYKTHQLSLRQILNLNEKQNLVVSFQGTKLRLLLNGVSVYNRDLAGGFELPNQVMFEIGRKYLGEISYITLNFDSSELLSSELVEYFKLGYPLPRAKELVDLTDTINGLDLFLDIGNIDKAIETKKGNLYVKSNSIKMRNL